MQELWTEVTRYDDKDDENWCSNAQASLEIMLSNNIVNIYFIVTTESIETVLLTLTSN